jgi:hypothetical protein
MSSLQSSQWATVFSLWDSSEEQLQKFFSNPGGSCVGWIVNPLELLLRQGESFAESPLRFCHPAGLFCPGGGKGREEKSKSVFCVFQMERSPVLGLFWMGHGLGLVDPLKFPQSFSSLLDNGCLNRLCSFKICCAAWSFWEVPWFSEFKLITPTLLGVFCSFRSADDILRVSIAVVNLVGGPTQGTLPNCAKLKGMLSILFHRIFVNFIPLYNMDKISCIFFKAVLASRVTF